MLTTDSNHPDGSMRMAFHHSDCEMKDLNELKNSPYQRNKHSKEQIERLAKIMRAHGVRQPIHLSTRSGTICFGHGRKEAALLNGWKTYPVVYQDFDSDEEEYSCVQSDNSIASWAELDLAAINADIGTLGPDFDIDLLGIEGFVIEPADKLPPGCDEDEVPEVKESFVKPGDIWQLGAHRLMCGDSTNIDAVEKLMNGEKAELCFTSPPYADQREYNGEKDLSTEHLATFIRAAYGKVNYFAVNLGYSRKKGEVNPYWDDYIKEAKECGLKLLSWNVWDKGHCGSIGNQNAMFGISHEWIFVFGNDIKELNRTVENSHYGEKTNHSGNRQKDGYIKKSKDGIVGQFSQLKTILSMAPQMARNHGIDHPAMFPVSFPESYIEAMTNPSHAVYEPFGGSGTTLIACEKTNRRCFMMELDPHYCGVIIERWQKYSGKKAELTHG